MSDEGLDSVCVKASHMFIITCTKKLGFDHSHTGLFVYGETHFNKIELCTSKAQLKPIFRTNVRIYYVKSITETPENVLF